MFFTRAAVAFATAAALALSGCAGFIDVSFPATADNITKMDCAKVSETLQAFKTAHDAPNGSPLHDELATKWKISSEEAYNATLAEFNTKRDACNAEIDKAPAPIPSVSTSPSAATTTATATSTKKGLDSVYCWGQLHDYIGDQEWNTLLMRVESAKDQLKFGRNDVEEWAKLNVDCRVIVAFDSRDKPDRLTDDAVRSIATKKIGGGSFATVQVVQADSSVQVAGEARINLSGDKGIKVILPRIVNGKSTPTSGVVITPDTDESTFRLLAGISLLK